MTVRATGSPVGKGHRSLVQYGADLLTALRLQLVVAVGHPYYQPANLPPKATYFAYFARFCPELTLIQTAIQLKCCDSSS